MPRKSQLLLTVFSCVLVLLISSLDLLQYFSGRSGKVMHVGLVAANFLIVTVLIVHKVIMLREVAKLEIHIQKQKSIKRYFLAKQKCFIVVACLLVFFNIAAFFDPAHTSILWLVLALTSHRSVAGLLTIVAENAKTVAGLALLFLGSVSLFALTIESDKTSSKLKWLGISTNYNISFIQTVFLLWQPSFYGDLKVQFFALIKKGLDNYLIALIIFLYLNRYHFDKGNNQRCQLCPGSSPKLKSISFRQANLHMEHDHNVFSYIACLIFTLHLDNNTMSFRQRVLQGRINQRCRSIFPQ